MRALAQARQLEYVSQTDILTGLKNRNYFEIMVQEIPERCASNLICVYGDVNGLHEINNNHGHNAGDKMLREVADGRKAGGSARRNREDPRGAF